VKRAWRVVVVGVVVVVAAGLATGLGACVDDMPPIIAHRALGVGDEAENLPANVPLALAAGFGAEVDIRGDGARPFELGHLRPNGHTLPEVFAELRAAWQPSFAGKMLILDVSNDEDFAVTDGLIGLVYAEIPGTELEALELVVEAANLEMLQRLRTFHDARSPRLNIRFALTYWYATEYTVPDWVDIVVANVSELPEFAHPKPLLIFGVESRNTLRQALMTHSRVLGVITDHPRRAAQW